MAYGFHQDKTFAVTTFPHCLYRICFFEYSAPPSKSRTASSSSSMASSRQYSHLCGPCSFSYAGSMRRSVYPERWSRLPCFLETIDIIFTGSYHDTGQGLAQTVWPGPWPEFFTMKREKRAVAKHINLLQTKLPFKLLKRYAPKQSQAVRARFRVLGLFFKLSSP